MPKVDYSTRQAWGYPQVAPAEDYLLPPLTVVSGGADWIIAAEDFESFYHHGPNGDEYFEADPGEDADFHYDCEHTEFGGYFSYSDATGRIYCACGYWYDRYAWGL
jgi:hypothetical protein